jgi:hypothetical protein
MQEAYQYLRNVKPGPGKLQEFEIALHLRLEQYDKLG